MFRVPHLPPWTSDLWREHASRLVEALRAVGAMKDLENWGGEV
jgi:hypothetical protein